MSWRGKSRCFKRAAPRGRPEHSSISGIEDTQNPIPWRYVMNWDQIAGNWKHFKGKVKEKWGKLTDDDLTTIAGKRDQLSGLLQQRYGFAKDEAEAELDKFSHAL